MNFRMGLLIGLIGPVCAVQAFGYEVPKPADTDPRMRVAIYHDAQVYRIAVMQGVTTTIVLGKDEQIITSAPGFGADCAEKDLDWCISANVGDNEVIVKPKSRAIMPNNLNVRTNKHRYVFDFVLEKVTARDKEAIFRVDFRYPDEEKQASEARAAVVDKTAGVEEKLAEKNKPRNFNYSKQPMPGSEGIDPIAAFDDGRFTYFKFAGNRQMPEVFAVEPDGSESSVATHVEGTANDTLVVHRVWKRFVLRAGKQVIGVWNDAFDLEGVTAPDGVTVDGVRRVIRSPQL